MYRRKLFAKRILVSLLSGAFLLGELAPATVVHANFRQESKVEDSRLEEAEKSRDTSGQEMTQEETIVPVELDVKLSNEELEPWKDTWEEFEQNQALEGVNLLSLEAKDDLPSSYNSYDLGHTPEARGQDADNCWAYAAVGIVEISMVKNGLVSKEEVDISEPHLIYYINRPVEDPLGGTEGDYDYEFVGTIDNYYNGGSSIGYSEGPLLNWMGPVNEKDFVTKDYLYTNNFYPDQLEGLNDVEHAYGKKAAIVVESVEPGYDISEMKRAIMEYGSLGIHYASGVTNNGAYYNSQHNAQYAFEGAKMDHAVVIVGWDDEFPKENFNVAPEGDGAWYVRNSWGSSYLPKGHFWLSYYDKSMSTGRAYNTVRADKYDKNYHYNRSGSNPSYQSAPEGGKIEAVNVYTIQEEGEILKAIQFGMQWSRQKYSIQVYKNPTEENNPASGEPLLEKPLEGTRRNVGVYTVDLEKPVSLKAGDKIAVSVTYSSDNPAVQPAAQCETLFPNQGIGNIRKGESFYRVNGEEWRENSEYQVGNFIIKAFTSMPRETSSETHVHSPSEKWLYNDKGHWKECVAVDNCDSLGVVEFHEHTGGTANCSRAAICEACGHTYGYPDPSIHVWETVRIGYRLPKDGLDGSTGAVTCSGCGVIFEASKVITSGEAADGSYGTAGKVSNLDFTFKDLEDQTFTTKVTDKPKVFIFYDVNNVESQNTMETITKNNLTEAVDFHAVEIGNSTKEEIEKFKQELGVGKSSITFGYDESSYAFDARIAYETAYNGMAYMPLPSICFINDKNELEFVSSGLQNETEFQGNLSLYCGVRNKGLDKNNPCSSTYTDFDGNDISMTANGKPKVLIFYTNSKPDKSIIESLSSEVLSGVDVQAYTYVGGDEESAKQTFLECRKREDSMKGCYNTDTLSNMSEYISSANITGSYSTPVVCYIDGDNKLQKVTTGLTDLAELKSNLTAFCGWGSSSGEGNYTQFTLTPPQKTTYFTGEELQLTGGKITIDEQEAELSAQEISGFHSYLPGEKHVFVTKEGVRNSFKALVVEAPGILRSQEGKKLSEVELPVSEYGQFSWKNEDTVLSKDVIEYEAIFTPTDSQTYNTRNDVTITVLTSEEQEIDPPTPPTPPEETEVTFSAPSKKIYLVGEELEVTGGSFNEEGKDPVSLEAGQVKNFDSQTTGKQTLTITYENKNYTYDIIVLAPLTAVQGTVGEALSSITLPTVEGGTYSFKNGDALIEAGTKEETLIFTASDSKLGSRDDIKVRVEGQKKAPEEEELIRVPEGIWITGVESKSYTGSKITQEFAIYDGTTLLKEKVDYTVKYKNNINANEWMAQDEEGIVIISESPQTMVAADRTIHVITGENVEGEINLPPAKQQSKAPQLIITMKGNYKGKHTVYFEIEKVDLTKAREEGLLTADAVTAKEGAKVPTPAVYWKGKALKAKKDFSAKAVYTEGGSKDKAGEYTIKISGMKNFEGEIEVPYIVKTKDALKSLSKARVTIEDKNNIYWQEDGVQIKEGSLKVMLGGVELKNDGTAYEVTYDNNQAVGTGYVIITGKGEYSGSKRKSFKIKGTAMKGVEVTLPQATYTYDGTAIEPMEGALVKLGADTVLKEGTDFEVTYKNNNKQGTATITLTGKPEAGYTGSKKVSFKINKGTLTNDMLVQVGDTTLSSFEDALEIPFTQGGAKPVVLLEAEDGRELTEGVDYTVKYSNNTKLNGTKEPTITIKGKGNYEGTISKNFKLIPKTADSNEISVVVKDKVAAKETAKGGWKSPIKVVDISGKTLAAKKDYDPNQVQYFVEESVSDKYPVDHELKNEDAGVPAGTKIRVEVTLGGTNGHFTGKVTKVYKILAKDHDISKAKVGKIAAQYYTGKEIELTGDQLVVTIKGQEMPLVLDRDYEITGYSNNITKGTAKVTLRGIGDFGGTKTVTFKIAQREIIPNWKGLLQGLFEKIPTPQR